jgi:hypothetical protein
MRVGKSYDIYAKVEAPPGSILYLTAAAEGYSTDPFVLYPWLDSRGAPMNQPVELNTWKRINASPLDVFEPPGVEVIKVVVNADQYDLHSLVQSLPRCGQSRGVVSRGPRSRAGAAPVMGWTALSRRVLIARPGAARAAGSKTF